MHLELKELVAEASRALARLDAERLEELALCCQRLNRNRTQAGSEERAELVRQAGEAAGDMAIFARVLQATRANMDVMNRLRELRGGRLEYGAAGWARAEGCHGDN
jgi:aminopeptidase N